MELKSTLLFALILLGLRSSVVSDSDCTYSIYVRTGTVDNAGTDAKVSLLLSDLKGLYIYINDLVAWGGVMEPGHDYFENGNADRFESQAACLSGPICWMQLTSDGTGHKPGWYVDYVEVVTIGPRHLGDYQQFIVNRWLATDEPPFSLQAIVNNCGDDHMLRTRLRPFRRTILDLDV